MRRSVIGFDIASILRRWWVGRPTAREMVCFVFGHRNPGICRRCGRRAAG